MWNEKVRSNDLQQTISTVIDQIRTGPFEQIKEVSGEVNRRLTRRVCHRGSSRIQVWRRWEGFGGNLKKKPKSGFKVNMKQFGEGGSYEKVQRRGSIQRPPRKSKDFRILCRITAITR